MKVLFLHPNFPAQFKHIAAAFAEQGNDVRFLCQTHYGRKIEGVKRLTLKEKLGNEYLDNQKLNGLRRNQALAVQYRVAFLSLKEKNWSPEIVISHSGWGCGINVKEIWPKTKLISYLEWWFNPSSSFFDYDVKNKELKIDSTTIEKQWLRNQTVALELSVSDEIVCPTEWQKSQLPEIFRKITTVIFDGIDTDIFTKEEGLSESRVSGKSIITYGTRGMDPMRAFPQFIKALPDLLNKAPELEVEIAGVDETFYGQQNQSSGITGANGLKTYTREWL